MHMNMIISTNLKRFSARSREGQDLEVMVGRQTLMPVIHLNSEISQRILNISNMYYPSYIEDEDGQEIMM